MLRIVTVIGGGVLAEPAILNSDVKWFEEFTESECILVNQAPGVYT